jgi:hypothetical protein
VHPQAMKRRREPHRSGTENGRADGGHQKSGGRRHLRAGRSARVLLAALPLAGIAWCLSASGGAAQADPISSCTTTSGVVIVVDFSAFGGAINRQCYPDITASTTAYGAMNAEGFTTQGDSHDGDAFVCRINDLPSPAQDPCVDTPPTSAYWAFWIANPGQASWSVSPLGAMSLAPKPGSTELWWFGNGASPPFPPSAVAATDPVTPTTAPPAVTTVPPSGGSGGASSGGGGGNTSGTNTTSGGAGTTGKSTAAPHTTPLKNTVTAGTPTTAGGTPSEGSRPPTTHTSTSTLHIVDAAPASADTHHTAGSPVALIVGGVGALALAAGALIVVQRRRRLE